MDIMNVNTRARILTQTAPVERGCAELFHFLTVKVNWFYSQYEKKKELVKRTRTKQLVRNYLTRTLSKIWRWTIHTVHMVHKTHIQVTFNTLAVWKVQRDSNVWVCPNLQKWAGVKICIIYTHADMQTQKLRRYGWKIVGLSETTLGKVYFSSLNPPCSLQVSLRSNRGRSLVVFHPHHHLLLYSQPGSLPHCREDGLPHRERRGPGQADRDRLWYLRWRLH